MVRKTRSCVVVVGLFLGVLAQAVQLPEPRNGLAILDDAPEREQNRAPMKYHGMVWLRDIPNTRSLGGKDNQPGAMIVSLVPDGPAMKAGLQLGDVMLSIDAASLEPPANKRTPAEEMARDLIRDVFSKKDTCTFEVLRDRAVLHLMVTLLAVPQGIDNRDVMSSGSPLIWSVERGRSSDAVINAMMIEHDGVEEYNRLRRVLTADERKTQDASRLSVIRALHRDPFLCEPVTDQLAGLWFRAALDQALALGVAAGAAVLDEPMPAPRTPLKISLSLARHMDQIVEVLQAAKRHRDGALELLTPDERRDVYDHAPALLAGMTGGLNIEAEPNLAKFDSMLRVLALTRKVRMGPMLEAAQDMARLADPTYLKGLRHDLTIQGLVALTDLTLLGKVLPKGQVEGTMGDLLAVKETPFGWVLIGGPGRNTYPFDAAVIVDVGGDDHYVNRAGASIDLDRPFGVVIDFGGNDHYSSERFPSQGSGFLGVGVLIDTEGDDNYLATQVAQGSGFLGVGMLLDLSGHDDYHAQEFSQGCGWWGLGLAFDCEGNDSYHANGLAQGLGLPKGCGVLVNGTGHDRYFADGRYPTSYRSPGQFYGLAQGMGLGLRGYRTGGMGMLLDHAGDDRYHAGNFSQGAGYYFGLGCLVDQTGDDTMWGSHYVQGTGVHSAIGVLINGLGRDVYQGTRANAHGMGHDMGVGVFVERGGDDTYVADRSGQGAAKFSAFAMLIDLGGNDQYLSDDRNERGGSQGAGGPNRPNRKDAKSLGILLDFGGGKDRYAVDSRGDGKSVWEDGMGLFVDSLQTVEDASLMSKPPQKTGR